MTEPEKTRKATADEIQRLYDHLWEDHKIERRGAQLLMQYDLPYEKSICEHDYEMVICLFCGTVVLIGISFENIDKPTCPCMIHIPNDPSEIENAK